MKKKTKKSSLREEKSYQEIVCSITKTLEEAYVQGVDFSRPDLLNCFSCGCFEGFSQKGSLGVYHKDGTPAELDVDFTVLDVKRRDCLLKNGTLRWRTTYLYICGLCGAEQKVCHGDEFSQKLGAGKFVREN